MTTKLVDARTLSCPQPVMLTIKALEEADEVITIVDNEAARENVCRLGKSQGCEVKIEQKADGIFLTLRKTRTTELKKDSHSTTGIVLFIGSDVLGRGDDPQLGILLMQKYLHALAGLTTKPEAILLVNTGVKLVVKGSLTAEALDRLQDQGIEIKACGTCLSHFQLNDKVGVGQVSDMYTIADTLMRAEKIISL
jgi:selenium metabolism protein YedF